MNALARRAGAVACGLALLVALTSCSSSDSSPPDRDSDGLLNLWRRDPNEPYPFTTPIPLRDPTVLDGGYERHVSVAFAGGRPVPCRRCAPYRIYAGETKFELSRGRFVITHDAVGSSSYGNFASTGHYTVEGDTIEFFNDVNCPATRGTYEWRLDNDALILDVVDDPCPYAQLRARYLSALPWSASGS
jgi:hypothetical protein